MTIKYIIFLSIITFAAFSTVMDIGKPRKPITNGMAVASLLLFALMIWLTQ